MSQLDRRSGSREARTIPAHETAYAEGLRITIRKADAEIARLRAENDRLRVALDVVVGLHLPVILLARTELAGRRRIAGGCQGDADRARRAGRRTGVSRQRRCAG